MINNENLFISPNLWNSLPKVWWKLSQLLKVDTWSAREWKITTDSYESAFKVTILPVTAVGSSSFVGSCPNDLKWKYDAS